MTLEYGGSVLRRNYKTGEVFVDQADDRIAVSLDLLEMEAIQQAHVHGDRLVLDSAGEYVYREVERDDRVAVFERIECPAPKPRAPAE